MTMTRCMSVMFSHPLRTEMRTKTLRAFAASDPDEPPLIVWTGDGPTDVDDFLGLVRVIPRDHDLLFVEDDVQPCRNALAYMRNWACDTMTSFYNPRDARRKYGHGNIGFIFSQAFKMPAALVARMQVEDFPPPHAKLQRDGIDQVVNRYLTRWRSPFYQHRSLVEHVGDVSTWTRATLAQPGRKSQDWPGPTVDALTFKWQAGKR